MKRLKAVLKWTGIALGSLIVLFVIAVFALQNRTYDAPYPNIHASTDSTVIARGRHLVYGPAHCNDCHGDPDQRAKTLHGEKAALSGGFPFKLPIGIIRPLNLTSDSASGIGGLSDGQVARILRYSVFPDGRTVFPFMPFQNMSDEDLTAVISYLRTLAPVKTHYVHREMNFMGKAVMAFLMPPIGPDGEPPMETHIDTTSAYGSYLTHSVANCLGCHTDRDLTTGAFTGKPFAGGLHLQSDEKPELTFITPNLTPDPETGHIFQWTEDIFVHRFSEGVKVEGTPMPWGSFRNMSETELKAIYKYLRSVEPVHNEVKEVTVPTE